MGFRQIKEFFIRQGEDEIPTNEQLSAAEFREVGSIAVIGMLRAEFTEPPKISTLG